MQLVSPGRIEHVSKALPPLAAGWARVRFAYCGVCGTDVSYFTGRRPTDCPVTMGHEWVAVVEAVSAGVGGLRPGDVVISDLNFRCGRCTYCASGRSHLCETGQRGEFTNRGFGTRADIRVEYLCRCVGPVSPRLALAEPLSCTLHALGWSRVEAHDRVLVLGAGGIGTCMAFALRYADAPVSFEVNDLDPRRLARLAPVLESVGSTVTRPTGSYDLVLDTTGSASGLAAACAAVAPGGRLCTMSHLPSGSADGVLLEALIHKDVTFTLSYLNGDRSNLDRAVALLERHWTDRWDDLIELRPLIELADALVGRADSPRNKTVIDLGSGR